jgi:hypothetical protein
MDMLSCRNRVVTIVAQLGYRGYADLRGFGGAVRVVAVQALPFCNRIMQKLFRLHRIVALRAEDCIILLDAEFVVGPGQRRMANGALSYDKGTVKVFVPDDIGVALGRHAAPERVRMLFLVSDRFRHRTDCGAKQGA